MKFQTNVSNSFKYQKVNTISLELFSVGNNKSWNLNGFYNSDERET